MGPLALMVMLLHITLPVVLVLSLLIFSGLRWKRVWFLSFVGIFFWGLWWVFCALLVCGLNDD